MQERCGTFKLQNLATCDWLSRRSPWRAEKIGISQGEVPIPDVPLHVSATNIRTRPVCMMLGE